MAMPSKVALDTATASIPNHQSIYENTEQLYNRWLFQIARLDALVSSRTASRSQPAWSPPIGSQYSPILERLYPWWNDVNRPGQKYHNKLSRLEMGVSYWEVCGQSS
jgi:hypothetical protein